MNSHPRSYHLRNHQLSLRCHLGSLLYRLAKNGEGSLPATKNRIDLACMQTQDALDDSDINVVLHLAHTAETYDDESWGHEAILTIEGRGGRSYGRGPYST